MSPLDVMDQTFVAAAPGQVATELAGPRRWRRWWPDLQLTVVHDRGAAGIRWQVGGALVGTMEMWLEPVLDGTVVHHFLHAEGPSLAPRHIPAQVHIRRLQAKRVAFEVKRTLEAGRQVGEPPGPPGGPHASVGPSGGWLAGSHE
ncbi:MAG: polyketide cyclase / dehydrase and lipid transport [Mycobacteriaceae bacterium]